MTVENECELVERKDRMQKVLIGPNKSRQTGREGARKVRMVVSCESFSSTGNE